MKSLKDFTDEETTTVLTFVQMVAGEMPKKAPAVTFLDLTEEESVAQAGEAARQLAERRRNNHGGRFLVDTTEEDKEIRASIRDWHRRTGRLRLYGVDQKE